MFYLFSELSYKNFMNFNEFFSLLKSIFTKERCEIKPTEENFNVYMILRYISFYHPTICIYINETFNNYNVFSKFLSPEDAYKYLKAIIPKLPYTKISYIKKPSTQKLKKRNIDDSKIEKLASYFEISKREVRDILTKNIL